MLGTDASIFSCDYIDNSAHSDGGAVFMVFGELILQNSNIMANTANANGGGVYMGFSSSLNSNNNTFQENLAGFNGGAIHMVATNELSSENDQFNDNSAKNGGCICIDKPRRDLVSMLSPVFDRCKATLSGGAVHLFSSLDVRMNISSAIATENVAESGAGGKFNCGMEVLNVLFFFNLHVLFCTLCFHFFQSKNRCHILEERLQIHEF
jgi:predicted outer membrane repeat protein